MNTAARDHQLPALEAIQADEISKRFRGFLPVVVDIETGGFDSQNDAILEIAAVLIQMDESGWLVPGNTVSAQVQPFPGAHIDPKAIEFNGIIPDHPLRKAVDESEAIKAICLPVRQALRASGCNRAIMVAHNPGFDLAFFNAAIRRTGYKRNPFHPFSTFDTASLAGLALGQTVLSRAVQAAGGEWSNAQAHSAVYDVEQTADLFCKIVNGYRARLVPEEAHRPAGLAGRPAGD